MEFYTVDILAGVGKWSWSDEMNQLVAIFRLSAKAAEDTDFPYTGYTRPELDEKIEEFEAHLKAHGMDPQTNTDLQLAKKTRASYAKAAIDHVINKALEAA